MLLAKGAVATFFVAGNQVAQRASTVARAVAAGHSIGLLGYDGTTFAAMTAADVRTQLETSAAAVRAAACVIPRVFRPPGTANTITAAGLASANDIGV